MKKCIVAAIILLLGTAHAYRKNVLIENFTATWCTYCPYQAQAIQQMEVQYEDSLTVIKYHPSTSDPFYDSTSVTRLNFYNVPGYPTSIIAGNKAVVGGWNGVYTPLNNYVVQSFNEVSPCSVKVEITNFNPVTLTATARIKVFMTTDISIPIPSPLRLRVAVLEDSIFYNWQNMNILRYVVRNMLPNAQGTLINLGRGDSATFEFNFNIPDPVRASYYYVAAFVQHDSIYQIRDYNNNYTLNAARVLQSHKARVRVNYGYLTTTFGGYSDENNNRRLERNESGYVHIRISNAPTFVEAQNVIISPISLNPYLTFLEDSISGLVIAPGQTETVSIPVQVGNFPYPQMARFAIQLQWDNNFSRVDTFQFKIGIDSVLVWDGSLDSYLKNYTLQYIDSVGCAYEWYSEADSGRPYIYDEYTTILYLSGQQLPDTGVFNMLQYLIDSGRNLIISGQNIVQSATSNDPDFLQNYLGVSFLAPNTGDRKLKGTGIIFETTDSAIIGGGGAYNNQNSKDVIDTLPGSNALPILFYRALSGSDADSIAGIYRELPGGNRLIFLAFGMEGVGTQSSFNITKAQFYRRLFLGISTGAKEAVRPIVGKRTILKSGQVLKVGSDVKEIHLFSPDGRFVKVITPSSSGEIRLDNLKSGIYYLIYQTKDGDTQRERLIIVK